MAVGNMSEGDDLESEPDEEKSEAVEHMDSSSSSNEDAPSIEIVDEDDDLAAVVENAMDADDGETAAENLQDNIETLTPQEPLALRWWNTDESHLSAALPEFRFLANTEVNRGLLIISLSTMLLQLWNMIFGIAKSTSGIRENSINWWNFFFGSGQDSTLAPSFADPLGWSIIIAAFCIFLSTMPRPKN